MPLFPQAGLESPGSSPLLDQLMLRMLFPRLSQCGSLALEDGADLAWWSRHLATLVCDWFERWGDLRLRVAQREGVPLAVAADDWTPEASLESRAQPLQSSDSGSAAASGGEASDAPRGTEGDSDSQDADDDAEDEVDEDDDQALEEAAAIPEATDEEVAEEKYWSALLAGFGRKSPLERSALFSDVPPQTRARLLRCLLQWRLRPGDELGDALRAEASASDLRVDPIGPTSSGLELILLPQFPLDVRIYSQSRSPGSSGLEAPEGFCLAAANDGEADALAGSLATADLPAADRAAARALRSRLKAMRRMRESVEAAIEEETKEVQRRQAKQQLALPSRRVATRSRERRAAATAATAGIAASVRAASGPIRGAARDDEDPLDAALRKAAEKRSKEEERRARIVDGEAAARAALWGVRAQEVREEAERRAEAKRIRDEARAAEAAARKAATADLNGDASAAASEQAGGRGRDRGQTSARAAERAARKALRDYGIASSAAASLLEAREAALEQALLRRSVARFPESTASLTPGAAAAASDEGARGSGALAGVGGGRNGGTAVLSPEAVWAAYWESRRADEEARACLVAAVAARLGAEEARAVEDTVREALEDSPDLDMADPGVAQALTADCRSRAARELGMSESDADAVLIAAAQDSATMPGAPHSQDEMRALRKAALLVAQLRLRGLPPARRLTAADCNPPPGPAAPMRLRLTSKRPAESPAPADGAMGGAASSLAPTPASAPQPMLVPHGSPARPQARPATGLQSLPTQAAAAAVPAAAEPPRAGQASAAEPSVSRVLAAGSPEPAADMARGLPWAGSVAGVAAVVEAASSASQASPARTAAPPGSNSVLRVQGLPADSPTAFLSSAQDERR